MKNVTKAFETGFRQVEVILTCSQEPVLQAMESHIHSEK